MLQMIARMKYLFASTCLCIGMAIRGSCHRAGGPTISAAHHSLIFLDLGNPIGLAGKGFLIKRTESGGCCTDDVEA